VDAATAGVVTVADRRPPVGRDVAPTAAPAHPERSSRRPRGIVQWRHPIVVYRPPILAPFPDVTVHIVQTPSIWRFLTYRMCLLLREPPMLPQRPRVVTRRPRRRGPGPARVLPLRLGRQVKRLAFLLRQPRAERRHIVPTHVQHWMIIRVLEPQIRIPHETRVFFPLAVSMAKTAFAVPFGFCLVSAILYEPTELPTSDFVSTEPERLCNPDAMLGGFGWQTVDVPTALGFLQKLSDFRLRRSHVELARRDEDEPHADRIGHLDGHAQILGPGLLMLAGHRRVKGCDGQRRCGRRCRGLRSDKTANRNVAKFDRSAECLQADAS